MKSQYCLILIIIFSLQKISPCKIETQRELNYQGTRQNGMGGSGYSFPYDENALLINPAGLGLADLFLRKFAGSYGNTSYLNFLKGSILVTHNYVSTSFQPFGSDKGGFAIFLDQSALFDMEGVPAMEWDPIKQEIVATGDKVFDHEYDHMMYLAYGKNFSFKNTQNHSFGITVKYQHLYSLNFNNPTINHQIYYDLGYCGSFFETFLLGFTTRNIPFSLSDHNNQTSLVIIPAIGFKRSFIKNEGKDIFSLFHEINYKYIFEKYFDEKKQKKYYQRRIFGSGIELGFREFIFIRAGLRLRYYGHNNKHFEFESVEISEGIGVDIQKKIKLNFYFATYIIDHEYIKNDIYNRFGTSISFYN